MAKQTQNALTPEMVREARHKFKATYEGFAAMLGVSKSHLCNIEAGRRRITPEFSRQFQAIVVVMEMGPIDMSQAGDPALE